MKNGFVKVCSATPSIQVAHCQYNANEIIKIILDCEKQKVKFLVFPELCITGYTCNDLFLQDTLLRTASEQLIEMVKATENLDVLVTVGLPIMRNGRLYNVAAVFQRGIILGMVPKTYIPNYAEFYEARYFAQGNEDTVNFLIPGLTYEIPFGSKLLFRCKTMPEFILGFDICEDLWMPIPPSSYHAMAGATVIANLSASDETTGKDVYRRELLKGQSARLICGYIYADAGEGESTTDFVFTGHNLIAENGTIVKESKRFTNEILISELDLGRLVSERRRMTTYPITGMDLKHKVVEFSWEEVNQPIELTRTFAKTPFVPNVKVDRDKRCNEILNIQTMGLKKRLKHTRLTCAVLGISGGLDSTLALLVTVKAFDMLGLPREQVIAVTMPCFGTTDRTYNNAIVLSRQLGVTLKEIPINEAVTLHFKDIEQDCDNHDITYENSQARERTQILMDIANRLNGIVIGTGDMSELALGWATYNGDHMSMYGVNCSVPKTLVRYLVLYYSETTADEELRVVLTDVLDTPVSPELLPPKDGKISQKTEDIVGPYELHDFFLYYVIRFGFEPSKIYRMACMAFAEEYKREIIYKWLKIFYQRFFSQQFKRSCLPDGPKVGSVALSPRGDLRMPSDAVVAMWMEDLEKEEKNCCVEM